MVQNLEETKNKTRGKKKKEQARKRYEGAEIDAKWWRHTPNNKHQHQNAHPRKEAATPTPHSPLHQATYNTDPTKIEREDNALAFLSYR